MAASGSTPFALPPSHASNGDMAAGHSIEPPDSPRTSPAAVGSRAPSAGAGRLPLPPISALGSGGTGRCSMRLGSLFMDDAWHDSLPPLGASLSYDNILALTGPVTAGSGALEGRTPTALPGRLLSLNFGRSMSLGRLSQMNSIDMARANSFDMGWLLADGKGDREGGTECPEGAGEGQPLGGGRCSQLAIRRGSSESGLAAAIASAPSTGPPPAKRQRRGAASENMKRQPSAAELVVGAVPPPAVLPAVEPLLVQSVPHASETGTPAATAAPLTPPAAEAAQRAVMAAAVLRGPQPGAPATMGQQAGNHLAALVEKQQAFARAAAAAVAAAANARASGNTEVAAAAQTYAAQYSAAAAHAATAVALQQQMQWQAAALASCANGAGGGTTGSGASLSPQVLEQLQSSQVAAAATAASAALASKQFECQLAQYQQLLQHQPGVCGTAAGGAAGGAVGAGPVPSTQRASGSAASSQTAIQAAALGSEDGLGAGPGPPQPALLPIPSMHPALAAMLGLHTAAAAMAAGAGASMAALAQQPSASSVTPQDKMVVWSAQNAMMSALHAGNPCPDLALSAAAGCPHWGGLGCAGLLPLMGMPAPGGGGVPFHHHQQAPQQHSFQARWVRLTSATPSLRLSTAAPVCVAAQTAPSASAGGGDGDGTSGSAGGSAIGGGEGIANGGGGREGTANGGKAC